MTITEFLLARIAEDEAIARAAIEDDNGATEGFANQYAALMEPPSGVGLAQGGFGEAAARMISTYAVPARVQAECEAKRRIVEWHAPLKSPPGYLPNCEGCWEDGGMDGAPLYPCRNLKWLALPYDDHPDYRDEWRVS